MPSPPGAVAVGEDAALDAVLLLIDELCFDTKPDSFFDAGFASAAGSLGPKDLKPPMLRDWD